MFQISATPGLRKSGAGSPFNSLSATSNGVKRRDHHSGRRSRQTFSEFPGRKRGFGQLPWQRECDSGHAVRAGTCPCAGDR